MAKLRTNRDRLVRQSVTGDAAHPRFGMMVYRISVDGEPVSVPGSGGITYTVRVTGKHGGIDHVMVDFTEEIMQKMLPGDRVLIRAFGHGLQLPDHPDVK